MLNAIFEYFKSCPLLNGRKISIDYLGHEAIEYSIDIPPFEKDYKPAYVDGGGLKQFVFIFGSREYYGTDVMQNLENSGFYNNLVEWVEAQNKLENLPLLTSGKTAQRIEIDTPGYLFDSEERTARYQVQMRLVYYEEF